MSCLGSGTRPTGVAGRRYRANNAIRDKITFGNTRLNDAAAKVDDIMAPRGRDGFADTLKPVSLGRTGGSEAFKEGANWDESYQQGQQDVGKK
jgi:hypothetical protein